MPSPRPSPVERLAMRALRAARIDSATPRRGRSAQVHASPRTRSHPAHGTNQGSPDGAQSKAGLLRSRWSSGPALSALWRSCVRLRSKPILADAHTPRIPKSESRPNNPDSCLDPAWDRAVSCALPQAVSAAVPASTAHSAVMAHVSGAQLPSIDFNLETSARPGTPLWHPELGVLRLERGDEAQDDRTRPPNSSSQCCAKLQCLWLQSMDCRFGQYIPEPMAFCAMGYRTWVALISGSSTV